tara:strand:+ start:38 stop:559 length:522 start_codon:yes stop_codon:yes gene_type:complete
MASKPGVVRIEAIGTRKLMRKLDALPAKIRVKIIGSVISKATTVMKREVVKRSPVGVDSRPHDSNGNDRKRLKKSFIKFKRTAKGKTGIHGIVGIPGSYDRFPYMLHHGIPAHTIKAPGGWSLNLGLARVYKSVSHPGVRPMPFMTEAMAASIPKARAIMASQLRSKLASVAK